MPSTSETDMTETEKPITICALSKYVQYHLDAATIAVGKRRPNSVDQHPTYSSPTSSIPEQDNLPTEHEDEVQDEPRDPKSQTSSHTQNVGTDDPAVTHPPSTFTNLAKLPTELQDQVWSYTMKPRIVELRAQEQNDHLYPAQRPPIMFHTSKTIRQDAMTTHGCLSLTLPARDPEVSPATFIINPKVDMLYISMLTENTIDPKGILPALKQSNILHEIRTVALDYTEDGDDLFGGWLLRFSLQSFSKLELVFIIVKATCSELPDEEEMLSQFRRYEITEENENNYHWIPGDGLLGHKVKLEKEWSRSVGVGEGRVCPQIVFVEEFFKRPVCWDREGVVDQNERIGAARSGGADGAPYMDEDGFDLHIPAADAVDVV